MQIALPRTQDAGKLQEQMGKQHQLFQESLALKQLKKEELKRKQVNEFERIILFKEQAKGYISVSAHKKTRKASRSEKQVMYPYLGKQIDYNG